MRNFSGYEVLGEGGGVSCLVVADCTGTVPELSLSPLLQPLDLWRAFSVICRPVHNKQGKVKVAGQHIPKSPFSALAQLVLAKGCCPPFGSFPAKDLRRVRLLLMPSQDNE